MHSLQKLQLKRVIHGLKEIVLKGKLKDEWEKKKEKFVLVTEMPFKKEITYWEMTQGIIGNTQSQLVYF